MEGNLGWTWFVLSTPKKAEGAPQQGGNSNVMAN